MEKKLKIIEAVEKELLNLTDKTPPKTFRRINKNQWIRNVSWPLATYKFLNTVSLGNVLPGSLSLWINNIKIKLGNKSLQKRGYANLLGYLFLYPFSKKREFNLIADSFYLKRNSKYVVLFYLDKNSVFKVNLRPHKKEFFLNFITLEVEAHIKANLISHPKIFTPKLKSYDLKGTHLYMEQELIKNSKSIKYLSDRRIASIYTDVFDFLLEFYKKNGVKLQAVIRTKLNKNQIQEALDSKRNADKIINKYFSLIEQKKKLLFGRIHNDLSTENILYTKDKVYLIDWGESRETFWSEEIIKGYKNLNKNELKNIFIKIIDHFNFDKNDIFSFDDQLFLVVCYRIFNLIENKRDRTKAGISEIEKLFLVINKFKLI